MQYIMQYIMHNRQILSQFGITLIGMKAAVDQ